METTTTRPALNEGFTAIAPQVEVDKFTQQEFRRYFVDGKEIGGCAGKDGVYQYCHDGRTLLRVIPWEKIETKVFIRVREYKTTVWEIV